ncbi:MAG: hypothetical protein EZS28_040591 [Streblomastix strix]|uniref:Uncharacterized protein n=1 Tax=Streblomastix strix TaxID=222440 RepID=A0A5J4U1J7_9EUKA|nr:MAG: hypothetical protein EZS28_040591 [Streblomastix strix]
MKLPQKVHCDTFHDIQQLTYEELGLKYVSNIQHYTMQQPITIYDLLPIPKVTVSVLDQCYLYINACITHYCAMTVRVLFY